MPTISEAYAALLTRARERIPIALAGPPVLEWPQILSITGDYWLSFEAPLRWPDEDQSLEDLPRAFVFLGLQARTGGFMSVGAGRGSAIYRNRDVLRSYVFVPRGRGLKLKLLLAERVASVFRGWAESGIVVDGVSLHPAGTHEALSPPGLRGVPGNYGCCVVEAPFHFDQIG